MKLCAFSLLVIGCAARPLPLPEASRDAGADMNPADLATTDLATPDLATTDLATTDLATVDLAQPDLAHPRCSGNLRALATHRRPYALIDVAAGDFDGDGHADFVTASAPLEYTQHRSALAWYGGRGDGTFDPPQYATQTDDPFTLLARDLDGDGRSELLVLSGDINSETATRIRVLSWSGGAWTERWSAALPATGGFADRMPIFVGPLDGDDTLDLAVQVQNALWTFPGLGDGTFGAAIASPGLDYPASGVLGDFDEDGHPDVMLFSGGARLFHGVGDGTFRDDGVVAPLDPHVEGLNAADLDGDGHLDLIADVDFNGQPHPSTSVCYGQGQARFGAPVSVGASGSSPHARVIVDLDGDRHPELVGAGDYGPSELVISHRNADGSFTNTDGPDTGDGWASVASADFDEDGRADLIVTRFDEADLTVVLNPAGGLVGTPLSRGARPGPPSLVDLDGDGRLDLLESDDYGHELVLRRGIGGGAFAALEELPYPHPGGGAGLVVGDFTGDGKPDAVIGGFGPESLLLAGRGDGSFDAPRTAVPDGSYPFWSGDFDRDGRLDLYASSVSGGGAALYRGNGDGSFAAPLTVPYGQGSADLDGDGILDLFDPSGSYPPGWHLYHGNGDGSFSPIDHVPSTAVSLAYPADLDGDGHLDFFTYAAYHFWSFLRQADGSYSGPIETQLPLGGTALADLDGDGRADLVVLAPGELSWWHGEGDGHFTRAGSLPTELQIDASQRIADLDGDGCPDLVIAESTENTVSVFLNSR